MRSFLVINTNKYSLQVQIKSHFDICTRILSFYIYYQNTNIYGKVCKLLKIITNHDLYSMMVLLHNDSFYFIIVLTWKPHGWWWWGRDLLWRQHNQSVTSLEEPMGSLRIDLCPIGEQSLSNGRIHIWQKSCFSWEMCDILQNSSLQ